MVPRLLALLVGSTCLTAQAAETPANESPEPVRPNLPVKTLGGRQFWADVHFLHGWRIQRNVWTGHCRLLDSRDVRHAWGSREQCLAKLTEIQTTQKLPPVNGEAVVLLHGIGRSSKSMSPLKKHLESSGFQVYSFGYPSTRQRVEDSADCLHEALISLGGASRIHLIGFSLGGLVIRSYLHRYPHEKIGRVLLIGTPNHGAEMADLFRRTLPFQLILGPAGQQLSRTEEFGLAPHLPPPDVEFGLIAGARGADAGFNPLIPGDDDGTVAVSSVQLDGAADFCTVPAIHLLLPSHPHTLAASVHFLQTGRFNRPETSSGSATSEPQP